MSASCPTLRWGSVYLDNGLMSLVTKIEKQRKLQRSHGAGIF